MDSQQPDYVLKVIILGESGTGKSSLLYRFKQGEFYTQSISTIGVDFEAKCFEMNGNQIKVHFWDVAGQEKFRSIVQSYFRSASGALLVFDLSSRDSFQQLDNWITNLYEYGGYREGIKPILLLVGNKVDYADRSNIRAINQDEIDAFMEKYGINTYLETSAKTGQNVDKIFEGIVQEIYDDVQDRLKDFKPVPRNVRINEFMEASRRRNTWNCC